MPPRITIISTLPDWCQDKKLGIDEAELHRRQIAGKAGQRTGEGEARELVAIDRKAERAHALLVAADADQRAAERRAQHAAQEGKYAEHRGEHHEVVEVRCVVEDRPA